MMYRGTFSFLFKLHAEACRNYPSSTDHNQGFSTRELNRAMVPNFNCLFVGVSEVIHVSTCRFGSEKHHLATRRSKISSRKSTNWKQWKPKQGLNWKGQEGGGGGGGGGRRCLQGNLWYSSPASMTTRLASVTFKMASKVLIEASDKNFHFITEILIWFLGFGDFKISIVIEN